MEEPIFQGLVQTHFLVPVLIYSGSQFQVRVLLNESEDKTCGWPKKRGAWVLVALVTFFRFIMCGTSSSSSLDSSLNLSWFSLHLALCNRGSTYTFLKSSCHFDAGDMACQSSFSFSYTLSNTIYIKFIQIHVEKSPKAHQTN